MIHQRKVPINETVLQLEKRILEAHANVQNLPLMEAKMAFIKAWQSLPDYGISYFIVKQKNAKKEVNITSTNQSSLHNLIIGLNFSENFN